MTVHQRYRLTDRRTDRQLIMAIPRYATLCAVKKWYNTWKWKKNDKSKRSWQRERAKVRRLCSCTPPEKFLQVPIVTERQRVTRATLSPMRNVGSVCCTFVHCRADTESDTVGCDVELNSDNCKPNTHCLIAVLASWFLYSQSQTVFISAWFWFQDCARCSIPKIADLVLSSLVLVSKTSSWSRKSWHHKPSLYCFTYSPIKCNALFIIM